MSKLNITKLEYSEGKLPMINCGNAYTTLTTMIDYGYMGNDCIRSMLSERMEAFNCHDTSVPLLLDNSIPSTVSSLSSVYFRGSYNCNKCPFVTDDSKIFPEAMLTQSKPNRDVINALVDLKICNIQSIGDLNDIYAKIKFIPTTGPASEELDKKRVELYLNKVDQAGYYIDSVLARLMLGSTIKVPFDDLICTVKKAWNSFASKQTIADKSFYLFVNDKIGSEHMIMTYLHEELTQFGVKGIVNHNTIKSMSGSVDLIVIDDVIYTGGHITGTFDEIGHNLEDFKGKINLYVIAGIGTKDGMNNMKTDLGNMHSGLYGSIHMYTHYQVMNMIELVKFHQIKLSKITNMKQAREFSVN